jgi:hypothetical protein
MGRANGRRVGFTQNQISGLRFALSAHDIGQTRYERTIALIDESIDKCE